MSLTHEVFRGGSKTTTLAGAGILNLIPQERWLLVVCTGTPGDAVLILPYAKGLPLGSTFHIMFRGSSTAVPALIRDNVTGTNLTVYDINGVARTSVDHVVGNWGSSPAIECRLIANTDGDGIWTNYSWSEF